MSEGFNRCYACERLFSPLSRRLVGKVVPMTSALNPSPWYRFLLTFKRGLSEHEPALAAIASAFIESHQSRISSLLGGSATSLTIVPSKRGIPYTAQVS